MIRGVRLAVLVTCFTLHAAPARARTWIIAADGSGDFTLLSAAYAAAASGDTVLIRPGHYQESDHDGCGDDAIHVSQKSITTLGAGIAPSDVSVTLKISFGSCPATVVRNLWFHGTQRPLSVYAPSESESAEISDCLFEDNGLDCGESALTIASWHGVIERCTFRRNSNSWADYQGGGAIFIGQEGQVTVRECVFEDNVSADAGGAIVAGGPSHLIESCVFVRNQAVRGGAIKSSSVEIRNCSFWDNRGDGAVYLDVENNDVHNCIVAGTHGGPGVQCAPFAGTPWCCDLWSNEGEDWCASGGTGNFSLDPMFCDPDAGDLTLQDASPCIDGTAGGYNCGQIGAEGVGCGESPTQPVTWGRLKSIFR